MPKQSLYNHFQKWNEDYYIGYNARSGAVALMTPKQYDAYQRLIEKLNSGQVNGFNEDETKLLKQAEYGRFVCADSFDEKSDIRLQQNVARYNCATLGLVIAPTMACNMACEYCYEANKTGKIDETQKKATLDFVEGRARGIGVLNITWYGGEPLLAMDVIEELSGEFMRLGQEHHFEYVSSVVTNGYLLTPEVADRLAELKVTAAQITLDGPAEVHNVKRPLKSGKDSFATIVENLKHAVTKFSVSIRVNIDQSFTPEIVGRLLDELAETGLRERLSLNFGHLETATKVCANIAESCFEVSSFSRVEANFYRVLLDRGFRIDKLPAPSSVACMAQCLESFVVDPGGELYRCWNYVGDKEKSMGNIKDVVNYQHPNFTKLFAVDPFEFETCRECNILPICMGACPSRRVDRNLTDDQVCESWKYNLEPMLEIIAASKRQEMLRAQEKIKAQEGIDVQGSAEERE